MKKYTQWYVYTGGDGFLNRVVSTRLEGEQISTGLVCSDGEPRDLWPCRDHSAIREFGKLNQSDGLKLQFFVKEGPHGQIRPWKFENAPSSSSLNIRTRLANFLRGQNSPAGRKARRVAAKEA